MKHKITINPIDLILLTQELEADERFGRAIVRLHSLKRKKFKTASENEERIQLSKLVIIKGGKA